MKRYDARSESWTPMEIKGVLGYFNDCRIDKDTIPSNFYFWELADGDSDGNPCRYSPKILVNFYGTFITTSCDLPIDDVKSYEGFINSLDEWGFLDDPLSYDEMLQYEAKTPEERRVNPNVTTIITDKTGLPKEDLTEANIDHDVSHVPSDNLKNFISNFGSAMSQVTSDKTKEAIAQAFRPGAKCGEEESI